MEIEAGSFKCMFVIDRRVQNIDITSSNAPHFIMRFQCSCEIVNASEYIWVVVFACAQRASFWDDLVCANRRISAIGSMKR